MNTTKRNSLPTLHVLYVTDSGIMDGKISMPVFIWGAYYFTGTSVTAKSFIAFIPGNNRSFVLFCQFPVMPKIVESFQKKKSSRASALCASRDHYLK